MIYNSIIMFKIIKALKRVQEIDSIENLAFINKIKYFPILLIIWWIEPTIHRIYQMISGEDLFFMEVIHILFECTYGCVNTLLYAINPRIKEIILKKFRKKTEKSESPEESVQEPLPINRDYPPEKRNNSIYIFNI